MAKLPTPPLPDWMKTTSPRSSRPALRTYHADDGPGIPPGERLDEAKPGSGLGLAIVRDLSMLHGGSVELTNPSKGGL